MSRPSCQSVPASHGRLRAGWFLVVNRIWLFLLVFAGWPLAAAEPALGLRPGEVAEFTAPFSPELRRFAGGNQPCESTGALAAVAVPKDFTPDRPWPVLVVSATSDPGYNSSRRLLRQFAAPALKAGWIVLAADATSAMESDSNNLRYALILAALERLRLEWSHLPEWPCAFGGFSGGAKRSASLAAMSLILGRRPLGVFQGGCNEPVMRYVQHIYPVPADQWLSVPVYLSSGGEDPIATREQVEEVNADLKRNGFKHVRLEHFPGWHELHAAHIEEALRWFAELAAKNPPAKRP